MMIIWDFLEISIRNTHDRTVKREQLPERTIFYVNITLSIGHSFFENLYLCMGAIMINTNANFRRLIYVKSVCLGL